MPERNQVDVHAAVPAAITTPQAAEYISQRGLRMSANWLRVLRGRGEGPEYYREPSNDWCYYSRASLDTYIEQRLRARQVRAPASTTSLERMREARAARARPRRRATALDDLPPKAA
jgi:hypothetical protein